LPPEPFDVHGLAAVAPFQYAFPADRLIVTAKSSGIPELLNPLAEAMAEAVVQCGLAGYPEVIVPIPLHHARRRERGFDQAVYLARRVGNRLERPVEPRVLKRVRATPPQKWADQEDRRRQLHRAFSGGHAAGEVEGRRVLLIDDVATTGATMRTAARALEGSGPTGILGLVAARTILGTSADSHDKGRLDLT
jgi:ComF family protein